MLKKGSDAFKNTNNASIYLTGKTKAPNTFDINWNSSNNPVYLNGNLCNHNSSTTVSLNDTHHGKLCNDCRTVISKISHRKYVSNGIERCYDCNYTKTHTHSYSLSWINYKQHGLKCSCGDTMNLRGHVVSGNWNGTGYATCLECGGPAEVGFVEMKNGSKEDHLLSSIYINEYFGNDSFILSNGVIVLSDIDLEAYYNKTLVIPETFEVDYNNYDFNDNDIYYVLRKTFFIPSNRKERDYLDGKTN